MDVQYVCHNLRGSSLVPLSLRTRPDGDDHFAIDVQLAVSALRIAGKGRVRIDDLRLAEIVGSGIQRRADTNADETSVLPRRRLLPLPVVPANAILGHLQHLRIVAGDAAGGQGSHWLGRLEAE